MPDKPTQLVVLVAVALGAVAMADGMPDKKRVVLLGAIALGAVAMWLARSRARSRGVHQPLLEGVRYSAFESVLLYVAGLATELGDTADCFGMAQRVKKAVDETTSAVSHIVTSTMPPCFSVFPEKATAGGFQRLPSWHEVVHPAILPSSHALVLVPVEGGILLLDPACQVARPIVLTKETGFRDVYLRPANPSRSGEKWTYEADLAGGRINVLAEAMPGDGTHAGSTNSKLGPYKFHVQLTGFRAPHPQVAGHRSRFGLVRTLADGTKTAHLSLRLDTRCVELFFGGEWRDALPFGVISQAEKPVEALLEWVSPEGLKAFALQNARETFATVAAMVIASEAPLASYAEIEAQREQAHAAIASNVQAFWAPLVPPATIQALAGGVECAVEIQMPWSKILLQGLKTVETRTYPYPAWLLGKRVFMLQSREGATGVSAVPDEVQAGDASLELVGSFVVSENIRYLTQKEWDLDFARHKVDPTNPYGFSPSRDKRWCQNQGFYGWVVEQCETYDTPWSVPALHRVHRSFFTMEW